MNSPAQILEKIESIPERIEMVAGDLKSGKDQFAKISPYELAELLGLIPGDGDLWQTAYVSREALENPIHLFRVIGGPCEKQQTASRSWIKSLIFS